MKKLQRKSENRRSGLTKKPAKKKDEKLETANMTHALKQRNKNPFE